MIGITQHRYMPIIRHILLILIDIYLHFYTFIPMYRSRQKFNEMGRDIYTFARTPDEALSQLSGGSQIIQFRAKGLPQEKKESHAAAVVQTVRQNAPGAFILLNDLPELAVSLEADGVHVGQDRDFRTLIQKLPDSMITGVSVDTPQEALEAQEAGAAYVGAGAAFPTSTKPDAVVIGPETIARIAETVTIPVVAIGGITLDNISTLLSTRVRFFAVISAVVSAPDSAARVRRFKQVIADY